MKIGSLVKSEKFTGEGVVVQIHGGECLVQHSAEINGQSKIIKQWYDYAVLTLDESVDETENQTLKNDNYKIELGIMPNNKEIKGGK